MHQRFPIKGWLASTYDATGQGEANVRLEVANVSRGGAALIGHLDKAVGTIIGLQFPGMTAPVSARLCGQSKGRISFEFMPDPTTHAQIGNMLTALENHKDAA